MERTGGSAPRESMETLLVHGRGTPDPWTGGVVHPLHLSTTFAQEELGRSRGFEYIRTSNPTRKAFEETFAALEKGTRSFAFASGMAAITVLLDLLDPGDHIVAEESLYGGTYRLFSQVASRRGIRTTFVDTRRREDVENAWTPKTRLLYVETPTNPTMRVVDIRALSKWAHERGALLVVDSTFSTPYLMRPLEMGADISLHSATKYIGGHSDVLGGVLTVQDEALAERIAFLQNSTGGVLSPFDSYLLLRGLKTLHLRMERHGSNARILAERLQRHPRVRTVHFPWLKDHPDRALAESILSGPTGMLSFEIEGGKEEVRRFFSGLCVFTLAESLGAVESLASHPDSMTHSSLPPEHRRRLGVTPGLVRLSVGIESVEDLWRDLERALEL